METAQVLRIFAILCIFSVHHLQFAFQGSISQEGANSTNSTNSSCVQAEAPVSSAAKSASCILYNKKGGLCENITSNRYIFGDFSDLAHSEVLIKVFDAYRETHIRHISDVCLPILVDLYCRYLFPSCDTSLSKPHRRKICRETCEYTLEVTCKKEAIALRNDARADRNFDKDMINCSTYVPTAGGQAPECYQHYTLPGDDTKSTDCYHGIGVGYRGNVNTTRTGLTCQAWTSQCPHRHRLIPEDTAHGLNDLNMCRNPNNSAPGGPWCYTNDPKIRWEYCNITQCPPRVPEEAPTFLEGRPMNSSAIHITWESIPTLPYKEKLLGYRTQYRPRGSVLYNEVIVTSSVTEAVVSALDPMTTYEIKVNGYNEIGHGPSGNVLFVKTLQSGFVSFGIKMWLMIDADFHNDLLNRTSDKFKEMEENITSSLTRQLNKSSHFNVYDVRVLRFSRGSRGSVLAHIVAFLITNNGTTKYEITNYFMEQLDPIFKDGLGISGVSVEEKPPPPENVEAKNVEEHYLVLTWDKPKHGSYYQIENYTIEQKEVYSDKFTVVDTLPYTQTGVMVKDLEPDTKYTIRLSSNNKYGRSDGVLLTPSTLPHRFLARLMLTIVLSLGLAVLIVVVACIKFRPICQNNSVDIEERGNWLELNRSDVQLQDKLGEGAFGEAFKGQLRMGTQVISCAVKRLKENVSETEKRDLVNELHIMSTVGEHPNVIGLIGACTKKEPVLVVVRVAQNGCLLNHLKKNRENPYVNVTGIQIHFTDIDRLRIARDVANGMLHLSQKKCFHRDLAARNVLLGENFVAMVSVFSLSRDVYESGEYENVSGGMLPIRWMALESLEDYTYNSKTDVWSFGVVLWEIESGGVMPYSGLGGMEVVEYLKSGQRLQKPDGCANELYDLMMSCWHPDPSKRPSFNDLVTSLEDMLHDKKDILKSETVEKEFPVSINLTEETCDPSLEETVTTTNES